MNTDRIVRSVVDLIVRCVDPEAIVLFGSVAQGRAGRNSDVDLLVVGRFNEPRALRGLELKGLVAGYALPIDLQLMTESEFEAELQKPFSLARTIQQHGVRLYERTRRGEGPGEKSPEKEKAPGALCRESFNGNSEAFL